MSVRSQKWKLILRGKHWTGNLDSAHLYDINNDPGEKENVAGAHRDVVNTISAMAELAAEPIKNNNPLDE